MAMANDAAEINQRLALLKQLYDEYCSLFRDVDTSDVGHLTEAQKARGREVLWGMDAHLDYLRNHFRDEMSETGQVATYVGSDLVKVYANCIRPESERVRFLLKTLDPDMSELFEMLEKPGGRLTDLKHVRRTFEKGVERIEELIESFPEYEEEFLPAMARDVLDSGLIRFEPDEWIINAKALERVLLTERDTGLSPHVRLRLEEIYRSFIFGNWIAVIALGRATLEFALWNNCKHYNIEPYKKVKKDNRFVEQEKDLHELIQEFKKYKPEIFEEMEWLRRRGNTYLHPNENTEEAPFRRQMDAQACIVRIRRILEVLYM